MRFPKYWFLACAIILGIELGLYLALVFVAWSFNPWGLGWMGIRMGIALSLAVGLIWAKRETNQTVRPPSASTEED